MTTPKPPPDHLLALLAAAEEAAAQVHTLPEVEALIDRITKDAEAITAARWEPYPWQVCPGRVQTHGWWLMLGGRGTGKTEGAARYVNRHIEHGPPCDPRIPGGHRVLIVAPTQGDAYESCYLGPSGMKVINPHVKLTGGRGGTRITWPNKASARLVGAYSPEDIERLRAATNHCLVWMEEVAAMRHLSAAMNHTAFGLRLGTRPHYVGSTTPKPRPELKELVKAPNVLLTKGRTADAHHLDPTVREAYFAKYLNTRIGRQELDAEILDDVEGALWAGKIIRHIEALPPFGQPRIVIGVDPPGSSIGPNSEAGIIVAAAINDQGYVLEDLSGQMSPEEWGRCVVDAYWRWNAHVVAVETTYGGEMVLSTIRTIDRRIPMVRMPTKVGKKLRAEPVVALYEQGRVAHIGTLVDLEQQMTTWVPGEGPSPDRVDALVHALTYLLVQASAGTVGNPARSTARIERGPGR
jgi:phage terminase large subunit-like protein